MLACLLAGGVAAVYLTHRDVTARMQENFAAGKYREAVVDLQTLVRQQPANLDFRVKLAESLLHTDGFAAAEAEYNRAIQLGAAPDTVRTGLVEAMLGQGKYQEALDRLDKDRSAGGEDGTLLKLRGRALLGLGHAPEARTAWLEAIGRAPRDPTAHVGLAQALLAAGDTGGAQAELDRANELGPDDIQVHLARGRWFSTQRQPATARTEFGKALGLARHVGSRAETVLALALLGEAECMIPDLPAAQKHLQELQQLAPKAEVTLLLQSLIALQTNHLDEAQATLKEVLSKDPRSEAANVMLGLAAERTGRSAAAESYLAQALIEQPDNLAVRNLLAEAQLAHDQPEQALRTATDPHAAGDSALLSVAGRASILEGDVAGGVAYFERSEKAAPSDKIRSLQVAGAYLAAHRDADALALLRKLEVPDDLAAQREALLLKALMASGHATEVRAEALRFAEARPKDPTALLIAAGGLSAAQDIAQARALLSQAAVLDAKAPQPWVRLGWLEWSQHDVTASEQAFAHALRLAPQDNAALLGAAQTDLTRGNSAAAIGKLEQVRTQAPRALPPRIALARLYLSGAELRKSAGVLAEAQALSPENPDVRQVGGLLAIARGNAPEGVALFEDLTKQFPKVAELQADLARAYLISGRASDAQASASAALRLDPGYWPALVTQIAASLGRNDLKGAGAALERLRQTSAPKATVLSVTGDVAASAGRLDEALKAYSAANATTPSSSLALRVFVVRRALRVADPELPLREWLQHSPTDVAARVVLAQQLQVEGKSGAATQQYETVLEQFPQQLVALNNLAWIKLDSGDAQAGLDLAHRAYANNNGVPAVSDTYGWALVQTGHADDAVPLLRAASDKMPANNQVRYHLGVALVRSGAVQEGRVQLKAVADSQDKSAVAERARALLATLDAGGKG